MVHILRSERKAHTSLIKMLISFSNKKGNTNIVLGFLCPTNELKDYSNLFRSNQLWHKCFPVHFGKVLRTEDLWTTASVSSETVKEQRVLATDKENY